MQTRLAQFVQSSSFGQEIDRILRSCVHCGFCNATCPTYQLLGDERDGPRGRIYLMKQMLEGEPVSRATQLHLDRCIGCLACETTCPSGVQYGHLLDTSRILIQQKVRRTWWQRLQRQLVLKLIPSKKVFRGIYFLSQLVRPILPHRFRMLRPKRQLAPLSWPKTQHVRKMLVLDGCVQPVLAPHINLLSAIVLDRLDIMLLPVDSGCCGALSYHQGDGDAGIRFAKRVIDRCWPYIEQGIEAIVSTASGCGHMAKGYDHLLKNDPAYAEKAARFVALTKDIGEIVIAEDFTLLAKPIKTENRHIAYHAPCSLQHGLKQRNGVEQILESLGYELTPVLDSHLCCGAGGAYSITQAKLADQLRKNKLTGLMAGKPDSIATANIGCLQHLQATSNTPVVHWIELLV